MKIISKFGAGKTHRQKDKNTSDTPPRTGNFGARSTYRGKAPAPRLHPIFYHMTASIAKATGDGRNYTVKIKVTADITVEPWQAEIGEYVPTDYFGPYLGIENQTLEDPDHAYRQAGAHYGKRVFQPTPQGYQRIE